MYSKRESTVSQKPPLRSLSTANTFYAILLIRNFISNETVGSFEPIRFQERESDFAASLSFEPMDLEYD